MTRAATAPPADDTAAYTRRQHVVDNSRLAAPRATTVQRVDLVEAVLVLCRSVARVRCALVRTHTGDEHDDATRLDSVPCDVTICTRYCLLCVFNFLPAPLRALLLLP